MELYNLVSSSYVLPDGGLALRLSCSTNFFFCLANCLSLILALETHFFRFGYILNLTPKNSMYRRLTFTILVFSWDISSLSRSFNHFVMAIFVLSALDFVRQKTLKSSA